MMQLKKTGFHPFLRVMGISLVVILIVRESAFADLNKLAAAKKAIIDLKTATLVHDEAGLSASYQAIAELGTNAIPEIREALQAAEPRVRASLIQSLIGIGDKAATDILLETAFKDTVPQVAQLAANCIDNRQIPRALTEAEVKAALDHLKGESTPTGVIWARLLAGAPHLDPATVQKITETICDRFVSEITTPLKVRLYESGYISGDVHWLNQFLIAFASLDSGGSIPVLKERRADVTDPNVRKWLMIALGMSRDPNVGDELRALVENDNEDVSLRAIALRAYAQSTHIKAIPLLEKFLNDKTPGPKPNSPPLAIVSQGELFKLRNDVKRPAK